MILQDTGNIYDDLVLDTTYSTHLEETYNLYGLPKDFYKIFWRLKPRAKDLVYTVIICGVPVQEYCKMRGTTVQGVSKIITTIRKIVLEYGSKD